MWKCVLNFFFVWKNGGRIDWDPDEDVETKMHRLPPLTGKYFFFEVLFCSVINMYTRVYMCVYTRTYTHWLVSNFSFSLYTYKHTRTHTHTRTHARRAIARAHTHTTHPHTHKHTQIHSHTHTGAQRATSLQIQKERIYACVRVSAYNKERYEQNKEDILKYRSERYRLLHGKESIIKVSKWTLTLYFGEIFVLPWYIYIMYVVIGKEKCTPCDILKNLLDEKGILYH